MTIPVKFLFFLIYVSSSLSGCLQHVVYMILQFLTFCQLTMSCCLAYRANKGLCTRILEASRKVNQVHSLYHVVVTLSSHG